MEYLSLLLSGLSLGCMIGWMLCEVYINYKKMNKVHFYLTRDLNGLLTLWFSKPKREGDTWYCDYYSYSIPIAYDTELSDFGLNYHDYDNLTWKDEPLEVFVNCDNW